jgi:uncharacterized protein (DUF2062 family)
MVLARRQPPSLPVRIRGWLWPHIGWRRAGRYLLHRLHRLPGTPHSIAAGLGAGIAMAFLPLIGLHTVGALALCWMVRGNYLAAVIGSLIGNPWTLPFMLASAYRLGCYLLGVPVLGLDSLAEPSWRAIRHDLWLVFWPMLVGAIPLGVAGGLASYAVLLPLVARLQQHRRQRIGRR